MANADSREPAPQLGPQPDFGRLTQGLGQAATGLEQATTEVANFANLPPFAQSNAILRQMQEIQQQA